MQKCIKYSPHPQIQDHPVINIPHRSQTFVKIDEPTLTHLNHPKSVVYIRAHHSCCICCGFGQTRNDMYPSLWYHTKYFHYPKNLCAPPFHPSSPPPATTDIFTVSIALPLPEHHVVGFIQYVALSGWLLSLSNMC